MKLILQAIKSLFRKLEYKIDTLKENISNLTAEDVGALPDTTTTLPNPNALIFTGLVTENYDGSRAIELNIEPSWDNLQNKPFGSNKETVEFTYDEEHPNNIVRESDETIYFVSDKQIWWSDGSLYVTHGGPENDLPVESSDYYWGTDGDGAECSIRAFEMHVVEYGSWVTYPYVVFDATDIYAFPATIDYNGESITFTANGWYVDNQRGPGIRSVYTEEIITIDEKYLPEYLINDEPPTWDDLEGKPFGTEVIGIYFDYLENSNDIELESGERLKYASSELGDYGAGCKLTIQGATFDFIVEDEDITLYPTNVEGYHIPVISKSHEDDEGYYHCKIFNASAVDEAGPLTINYNGESVTFNTPGWYVYEEDEPGHRWVMEIVKEVVRTIDPKYLPEIESQNADWNAAEGEPGHVLNRTHWVEGGVETILEETVFDVTLNQSILVISKGLEAGKEYTVIWNNVEYQCIAKNIPELGPDSAGLGNLEAYKGLDSDGSPFTIVTAPGGENAYQLMMLSTDGLSVATVGIYVGSETIHKLSQKFLPNSDWNAAEGEEGHILNRTHYEGDSEERMFVGSARIYTNNKNYKILDNATIEVGERYTVVVDGVIYSDLIARDDVDGEYHYPTIGAPLKEDGSGYDHSEIPWAIYTNYVDNEDGEIYFTHSVVGRHSIVLIRHVHFVKTIDPKFLPTPDWNATKDEEGHVLNRTHWVEQSMKNIINAEYTTELTEVMDGVNIYAIQIGFEEKLTSVPNEIIFTYDNIDYNITFTEMDMGIIGGNMSYMNDFLGTSFENTNEPFLLAIGPYGCSVMTLETSPTSHLCKIDIPIEIVHQLDPKFIPIEEPVPSDWNASEGEPGYIINKPSTMPNPYTLYFTGAVTGSYNGSYSQTINIPKTTSVGRPGTGTDSVIFNSTTNVASGNNSFAEGYYTKAIGENSHAEGKYSRALGLGSHAEGNGAAIGEHSHAEGYGYAYGDQSHSEGNVAGSWDTLYDTITGEAGSLVYTLTKKDNSLTQGMVLAYNDIFAKIEYISNDIELHLDKTLSENEPLSLTEIRVYRGGATGYNSHSEGSGTLAGGSDSHAEGRDTKALGFQSHAEGEETQALDYSDHAEGSDTIASGGSSHAEGSDTVASGNCSHAEGDWTEASGTSSHAEGYHTKALGKNSHAEGDETQAIGLNSHAEGDNTIAQGESSHAEGQGAMAAIQLTGEAKSSVFTVDNITNLFPGLALKVMIMNQNTDTISYVNAVIETVDVINKTITLNKVLSRTSLENCIIVASVPTGAAFGDYSHSEGMQTVATGRSQHVQGEFNIPDYDIADTAARSKYTHIVGNGADNDNRSNAHTLDWDGNAWYAGDVYVGSTSGTNRDEGSVRLARVSDIQDLSTYEFITTADIDTICGASIVATSEVTF